MPTRPWKSLLVVFLLLTAGCSQPERSTVATARTGPAPAGGATSAPAGGASPQASPQSDQDKAISYARCMTDNGSPIPDPVIGFPLGRVDAFDYASYGTSYLLDFSAPRWVQCHYTPAPILEDLDEEERAELAADGGLEESWSCPSTPPELW